MINVPCILDLATRRERKLFANDHDVGGSHTEEYGIILVKGNISEELAPFFAAEFKKELDELK